MFQALTNFFVKDDPFRRYNFRQRHFTRYRYQPSQHGVLFPLEIGFTYFYSENNIPQFWQFIRKTLLTKALFEYE